MSIITNCSFEDVICLIIQSGDEIILKVWNVSDEENLVSIAAHDIDYSQLFPDYSISDSILTLIVVIYISILLIGLVGNILTILVFIFSSLKEDLVRKSKFSAIKYYLLSLAMSDLLMLFSGLPYDVLSSWKEPFNFGDAGCFIQSLVSQTSLFVSVLTIVAFTIERYLSICHPFIAKKILSIPRSIKVIIATWILGFLCGLLLAWQGKNEAWGDERICKFHYSIPFSIDLIFIVIFFAPLLVMLVLYALIMKNILKSAKIQKNRGHAAGEKAVDSEKRIVIMLVIVVITFLICMAPSHILTELQPYFWIDDDIFAILFYLGGILNYLSGAINPIIYNVMSSSFRSDFKKAFLCKTNALAATIPIRKKTTKSLETIV